MVESYCFINFLPFNDINVAKLAPNVEAVMLIVVLHDAITHLIQSRIG